ncbi:cyclic nucleotide-gated ion channel 1-like isoform X4 [Carya illinoinensis]|uniref:cyclic nucleotide-gated ion channel 1-like isoform X4 n=1 Tax=Carya illinoinensis TaxID=32201 RepID=UPI001C71E812|nr:cyclic nucleotide-gated ion channel 1-like isoform X4 [Carya illinoinensis]
MWGESACLKSSFQLLFAQSMSWSARTHKSIRKQNSVYGYTTLSMSFFGQRQAGEEPENRLMPGPDDDDDGIHEVEGIEMQVPKNLRVPDIETPGPKNEALNSRDQIEKTKKRQQPEWVGKFSQHLLQQSERIGKVSHHLWQQSERIGKKVLPKRKPSAQFWYNFLAGSCVISVSVDPFFFYIPVINEVGKCVDFDRKLYSVIVCLRTLLDGISLVDIILPFLRSCLHKEKETKGDTSVWLRIKRYLKVANDIIAILPIPQVLGGLWYFFSVLRETACWHLACENRTECDLSSFACNDRSISYGNFTFLNDSCPIAIPNTKAFDFGIFQVALQSGIVESMDFPRKTLYCFWWGLRNLSSFGSNLQTSPHFWENGFAVLTSITGLVLFVCLLGHLQMYTQWEASKQLEEAKQRELEEATNIRI